MNGDDRPFLIVDDEPEMCWVLENILTKNGFLCRKALRASDAVTMMESHSFRMSFLDAKLPDIDGLELARRLRKLDPRLPIVVVSGYFYRDDATIEEAIRSGLLCAFIGKPFDHDEIARVIACHAAR